MVKIVINGPPGAGKDTVVKMTSHFTMFMIVNLSTVDMVKAAARFVGWNGEKDSKSRLFLSDLKDLSTKFFDGPFQYIKRNVEKYKEETVIFIHSREPEEIQRFKEELGCYTLFIDRKVDVELSNHADRNVSKYQYDFTIKNDGDLGDLLMKVGEFFRELTNAIDQEVR